MKLKLQSDNLILKLKELENDSLDIISISNKAIIQINNVMKALITSILALFIY